METFSFNIEIHSLDFYCSKIEDYIKPFAQKLYNTEKQTLILTWKDIKGK